MKIANQRTLKIRLSQSVKTHDYYIFIAPLNTVHFSPYKHFISKKLKLSGNLQSQLENENNIRDFNEQEEIDSNIVFDTELYVNRIGIDNFENVTELLKFTNTYNIRYRKIIGGFKKDKILIDTLENKAEN